MIRRNVIGDEVENQRNAPVRQRLTRRRETRTTAQSCVDLVTSNAVRGSDHVVRHPARQGGGELRGQSTVRQRHLPAGGAALPHPHQPDRVETGVGDRIPVSGRNRRKIDRHSSLFTEFRQPRPRVDLVDERMRIHRRQPNSPGTLR